MNTQERDQLNQLLKPLAEFKLSSKDNEAESLIREAVARQPDAAYLLVQRVMLLEQALNTAKTQIGELQKQLQNSQSSQTSAAFLGNDPWAQPPANAGQVPGAANYQIARTQAQPQAPGGFLGGGSSFLGNVATTAAGVVAGSFLFQGIENLLGHHSSGFGQPGFGQQPLEEQFTEQTVINNYYGDDAGQSADNSDIGADFPDSDDDDFLGDNGDSDWT